MHRIIGVVPAALLLGLVPAPASASTGSLLSHYVIWGPGAQPIARVVLDGTGQSCPTLDGTAMTARTNPNPTTFPITVCEGLVTAGQAATVTVAGNAVTFPAPDADPQSIAIFGDSGCKSSHQDCTDPDSWPWPAIATAAAATDPDLVIHVGDYNYRGTPSEITINGDNVWTYDGCDTTPVISQNAPGSSLPDNWADWNADLFTPAAALLQAAAWVVMRGNHELCTRAGPGWFYLLDPRSNLLGPGQEELSCPATPTVPDITATFDIPLADLNLVMLDSANACDSPDYAPLDPVVTAAYAPIMKAVTANFTAGDGWLMTHRPVIQVYAITSSDGTNTVSSYGNQTLLADLGTPAVLPGGARVTVSGHMHLFQSSTPSANLPPQMVIGNSGVHMDTPGTSPTFTAAFNGAGVTGNTMAEFGWLHITRFAGAADWSGTLVGTDGSTIGTCGLPAGTGGVCTMATAQ